MACRLCGQVLPACVSIHVTNLPRFCTPRHFGVWVQAYVAIAQVHPLVQHGTVQSTVLTFPTHEAACFFLHSHPPPFSFGTKQIQLLFSWYVKRPPQMSEPGADVAKWHDRVLALESQHGELRTQLESVQAEMTVWRETCTSLSALLNRLLIAPVLPPVTCQPLSPKSCYTDPEVESFLQQCLP